MWLITKHPAAVQWIRDTGLISALLGILLIITLIKQEYPEHFTPSYGSHFIEPLTKTILPEIQYSLHNGISAEDFLAIKLPLLQNIDTLSHKMNKKSNQVFQSYGQWSCPSAQTRLDALSFGLLGKKNGFVYKGFLLQTTLEEYNNGKHILFTHNFSESLGKAAENLSRKQLMSHPLLGEDWIQYSSTPLKLNQSTVQMLEQAFSPILEAPRAPSIYLTIKGRNLIVWYDCNKLGFDPLMLTKEHTENQLRNIRLMLTSAAVFWNNELH